MQEKKKRKKVFYNNIDCFNSLEKLFVIFFDRFKKIAKHYFLVIYLKLMKNEKKRKEWKEIKRVKWMKILSAMNVRKDMRKERKRREVLDQQEVRP